MASVDKRNYDVERVKVSEKKTKFMTDKLTDAECKASMAS
jgi:hypothetical protein